MAFDVRKSGDHAKIILSGDVDLQTTADLKSEIQNITDARQLDIDASQVTYIDSSGVAVLLLARQHCSQNNITLSLSSISDAVNRVLQIAKLDAMLPIGEVVDTADSGVMGLGAAEAAAPTNDDDLVNELLAGEDFADPVEAGLPAGEGSSSETGNFGGLDVNSVDFSEPASAEPASAEPAADGEAAASGDAAGDGMIKPGTFS